MLQRLHPEKINLGSILKLFGVMISGTKNEVTKFGLANCNQLLNLSSNAVSLMHMVVYLYKSHNRLDEGLLRQMSQEHESAVNSYREAQRLYEEGSVAAAIQLLDTAIQEFTLTSSHVKGFQILKSQRLFLASLYLFKSTLLFTQNNYQDAIENAYLSLQSNQHQPLAYNLLAFIYIYFSRNETEAHFCLKKFLELNTNQAYTAFFLAHLNNDANKMEEAFAILRKAFNSKESKVHDEADKTPAVINLEATTLPFFIPYMATEWLALRTQRENNCRELANVAAIFGFVISHCQSLALEQCRGMLLEKRILVLKKIAQMRGSVFESFDLEWRDAHSHIYQSDPKLKQHFFNYPAKDIDHTVLKLLSHGTDCKRLTNPGIRSEFVKYIIAWAKLGRFTVADHPDIIHLKQLVKNLGVEDKNSQLKADREIETICTKPAVIEYFIETYLANKGWEPWFTLLKWYDSDGSMKMTSLIQLACREQKVNPIIYKLNAEGKLEQQENLYNRAPHLHLLIASDSDQLSILHPLNSPADIYKLLLRQDCQTLLTIDPRNELALQIQGERRTAFIPTIAAELITTNPAQAISQLRLFTQVRNEKYNRCTYENSRAEFILAVAHSHQKKIEGFDIAASLKSIINSEMQPYADCARVLRARMQFRYMDLNAAADAKEILKSNADLTQTVAKNMRILFLAEYYLHGDHSHNEFTRPKLDRVKPQVLQYLNDAKIISGGIEVTPELLTTHLSKIKGNFIARYCLGYAAALLAAISTNKEIYNEYCQLSRQCGFYSAGCTSMQQVTYEVLGIPTCAELDLDVTAVNSPELELSSDELKSYREKLQTVYTASSLLLSPAAYASFTLKELDFTPPWHLSRFNWFNQYTTQEERWLQLRDAINQGHFCIVEHLVLCLELNPSKPPINLSEISFSNLAEERQRLVANCLVHLLASADIKSDDYSDNCYYDVQAFNALANSHRVEERSACRIC